MGSIFEEGGVAMRRQFGRKTLAVLAGSMIATLGLAGAAGLSHAQDPADDDPKAPASSSEDDPKSGARKGGLRLSPKGQPKTRGRAPDPLAGAGGGNMPAAAAGNNPADPKANAKAGAGPIAPVGPPKWPFHYEVTLDVGDGLIAADYYPAEQPFEAPVVLLIHEPGQGRSAKDFQDPIAELKDKGFANDLQEKGYAVLALDLRGHGRNDRGVVSDERWQASIADLQAAYRFLIDRNNRGELNLGKFAAIGVGESGNLIANWAASPAGAVSNEGRFSDLGALVMVSPVADARGLVLARLLPRIAPRFPIMLVAGDRDDASIKPVRDAQPVVERHRLSRAEYYDTALHASKLLSFFPEVPEAIEKFLDDPVKFRNIAWEPRYLLDPVAYGQIQLIADSGTLPPPGAPAPAPAAAPAANPPAPKAQGKTKSNANAKGGQKP